MWKQFIKDYFNFSKKERVAVLLLLTAILFVILIPYWWLINQKKQIDAADVAGLKKQLAQLNLSNNDSENHEYGSENNYAYSASYHAPSSENIALFHFDPNQLPVEGWKQLGLKDKTIKTIQNYLAKGGHFYHAEDLGKIYGLSAYDYERLYPYIKIKTRYTENNKTEEPASKPFSSERIVASPNKTININIADTSAWIALPGIGSKLAGRIVNFRDKLGGFYSTNQVAEIYGLPDSTFQKIKLLLQYSPYEIRRLNINTADVNTLKQHPYIKWQLANAIIQYRQQHGNYQSIDDLLQITILTPELFQKIKPYLVVQ
jgi:competence protein ComEA